MLVERHLDQGCRIYDMYSSGFLVIASRPGKRVDTSKKQPALLRSDRLISDACLPMSVRHSLSGHWVRMWMDSRWRLPRFIPRGRGGISTGGSMWPWYFLLCWN
jgi:hypothetical protein